MTTNLSIAVCGSVFGISSIFAAWILIAFRVGKKPEPSNVFLSICRSAKKEPR